MFFDNKSAVIGEIRAAMLTETQFQQQAGSEWVLADGRTASGTRYNSITGNANIPDFRGTYLRGKNNSRSDGKEDPAGEQALGTYEADQNLNHTHDITRYSSGANAAYITGGGNDTSSAGSFSNPMSSGSNSGNDARPRSYVINWFIKIN